MWEGDCGEDDCGEDDCGEGDYGEDDCGEDDCGEDDCGEGDCGEGDCGEGDCGKGDCGEGEWLSKKYLPHNSDTLSLQKLFSDDTGQSADEVAPSIDHYKFLEPHSLQS